MRSVEPGHTPRDVEHDARALSALERAFTEIPFYIQRGRPLGGARASLAETLAATPLLWKSQVRPTLPKQWIPADRDVKAELASGALELVETSGSTSDRTRILWDQGWWLRQEERGLRTNPVVSRAIDGAHGLYREAILTTPACGLGLCHTGEMTYEERVDDRYLFLNMRPDPAFWKPEDMTRMIEEIRRHRTVGLESDPTYLSVLARHASRTDDDLAVEGFVALTYSMTSAAHLRSIRRAIAAPALQLYGASEVGVLFMEGEDGRLHHCPGTTHVEFLFAKGATPGAKDVALVVVTTIDRVAQPLVRFVVGDLVQVDRDAPSRFTTVAPLVSMEGRVQDAVLRPDGGLVTAGAIDRALAGLAGIVLYQVNQRTPREVEVDLVAGEGAPGSLPRDARDTLAPLLSGLDVTARRTTAISAEPSGKYRLVRRHFPFDLGDHFPGCEGVSL